MGAISDFVGAYTRDYEKYLSIEQEVRALCEESLRDIQFLWQSRVKAVESLEKKSRDRSESYKGEAENVADVVDLVAGRIILADWRDFERVEEIVKHKFNFRGRVQHPKPGQKSVNSQSRFRGYGGRHFHVTRKIVADQHSCNPVVEIQVMTAYMWAYATLAHDIEYKKLHGEPSEDLVLSLEVLKGIANLGEIDLDMFNRHFLPVARLSPQQSDVDPKLPSVIQTVGASVWLDENDKQCIRDLRLTDPRHDKERIEASKDQLLEGSCSWVLEDPAFVDWWTRDDARLLWIHGDPGKGKTMMMIALISEVSKRLNDRPGSNVLAYFFCQNTCNDLNTTVSVLRGLIYLLVDQEKKLVRHIRKHYDSAGTRMFEGPNATYALREILSDILKDQSLGDVFFMIDALDECDPKIHELLDWIVREEPGISPKVKWLTTSRNVPVFTERLLHDRQLHTSLELNSLHVARAVTSYIDYKVKELANLKSYASGLQVFVRKSLLQKAEDTFLWVALVCKELRKVRQQKVRSLLEKFPAGLIPLYERMLEQVLDQEDENDIEISRRILRSVTLALRPLRLKEIAVFAEIPDNEDIEELLGLCGSFLAVREETVYLVHQSAKDYLSDGKRKELFLLGLEHEHANVACLCLKIMSTILRKDICNLQTPGFRLSDVDQSSIVTYIPFYAQYACLYWADHLQQAGSTKQETLTLGEDCHVLQFFQDHFLHWLETLILINKYSQAILAIRSLGSIQRSQLSTPLSSFVEDAQRFILGFRSILETAPLQIYISAPVFCPKISIIKRLFSYELPSWIKRLPSVDEAWSASLQTLEGHSSSIIGIVFSPDSQLLASASNFDNNVRIWNAYTGALICTLSGKGQRNIAMLFISNGLLLISGLHEHISKIWDPITEISQDIHECQLGRITARAFCSDGRFLASASSEDNYSIRLWNPLTGNVRSIMKGHLDLVRVMTFAPPNGQLLASGSEDATVKLWDSSTGGCRRTLKGHSGSISALAFSPPDGRLLASVAECDFTIRLWDTSIGSLKGALQGHSNCIVSILFSPDGQLLVSSSSDNTTRLWDSATGTSKGIIEGDRRFSNDHTSKLKLSSSNFSPDGRLLAVSCITSVQLWDPVAMVLLSTLSGHSDFIQVIQFSSNGHLLATGSEDTTVRLWDVATEASQNQLEGHSPPTHLIVFSPCCHLFASGSPDTIRLWDSATGTLRCSFEDQSSLINAMTFFPDSQLLASGYLDGTVRLWDPATGASGVALEGHTSDATAVAFSPDGQILASGSGSKTIILWDPVTGASRGRLECSSWAIRIVSLAFSTDGQILASANDYQYHDEPYIMLWILSTCTPQGTLRGVSGTVKAMIFSPDSQLLASASNDTTVRVWNIKKGTLIHQNKLYRGGNFSFNEEGSQLEISGRVVQISSSLDESADEQVWTTESYALDAAKEWVTYKGSNVIRLPPNRRPEVYAVRNKTLILGGESGLVTFLEFSSTIVPLCT